MFVTLFAYIYIFVFEGVVFEEAIGNNDGKVKGHTYFKCAKNHGVLVPAVLVAERCDGLFPTWGDAVRDAVTRLFEQTSVGKDKVSVHVSSKKLKVRCGADTLYACKTEQ